jgi:SagB-type dehydrogenase family enzyme
MPRHGLAVLAIVALLNAEILVAESSILRLPEPVSGPVGTLGALLRERRTVRAFSPEPLTLEQVGQLLWAAQGITSPDGFRTAPSAGALYPLELHLIAGAVTGLPVGHYRYVPARHGLDRLATADRRVAVAQAAHGQAWIAQAPALVVIAAVPERTRTKYGSRSKRYVDMEVGHASQNLLLQVVALGLGGAVVGAFDDAALHRLLDLPKAEEPLVILPIGHARGSR